VPPRVKPAALSLSHLLRVFPSRSPIIWIDGERDERSPMCYVLALRDRSADPTHDCPLRYDSRAARRGRYVALIAPRLVRRTSARPDTRGRIPSPLHPGSPPILPIPLYRSITRRFFAYFSACHPNQSSVAINSERRTRARACARAPVDLPSRDGFYSSATRGGRGKGEQFMIRPAADWPFSLFRFLF